MELSLPTAEGNECRYQVLMRLTRFFRPVPLTAHPHNSYPRTHRAYGNMYAYIRLPQAQAGRTAPPL